MCGLYPEEKGELMSNKDTAKEEMGPLRKRCVLKPFFLRSPPNLKPAMSMEVVKHLPVG